ncbi:MAG: peptidoglycan DD-metalloendopeptidase family protein [Chloroflexota bacterium]
MKRSSGGLSAFIMLLMAVGIFGAVLWFNADDATPVSPVIPTEQRPTSAASVGQLLDENFGNINTPLPTIAFADNRPTVPVVAQPAGPSPTPISASDASSQDTTVASAPLGITPTLPPPTANAPVQVGTTNPEDWNLPALVPPLSRDPQGRDHYWFRRPIESSGDNRVLMSYTYGAGGFFGSRIHHGIDMPNREGEVIYAPAAGEVIFASDGRGEGGVDVFQNTVVYGNVVFLLHDFGYQGQPIYTLYAHLLTSLVQEGDYVEVGDPIGLVGSTGQVTGSHVHFEVRIGGNGVDIHPRYGDTYNPALWMVPYVGHGVVAGRVLDINGEFLDDATVTVRNRTGVVASVPTYRFQDTVNDVNPDPLWRENFAVGDIPVGTYDVLVRINGQLVIEQIQVFEGMTAFIELRLDESVAPTLPPAEPTTIPATPVTPESESVDAETNDG